MVSRKTIFVKPFLQIKYSLITVAIVALTVGALFFIFSHFILGSEKLASLPQAELALIKRSMMMTFLWTFIALSVAIGIESIFLFHRLIGPIYVVEKVIRMIADGNLTVYLPLRKGDDLKEFERGLDDLVGGIRRRVLSDRKTAENISLKLDAILNNGASPTAKDKIKDIKEKLTTIGSSFRL